MIYLICAQNKEKELVEIAKPKILETKLWNYFLEITNHRNVLYSYDFYKSAIKQVLPNRVNIIFTEHNKKSIPPIMNAIVENKTQLVTSIYQDKVDDIYIIGDKNLVDIFYKVADFLIVYTTDELPSCDQSIFDAINFSHYSILKKGQTNDHTVEFYVKVKTSLGM